MNIENKDKIDILSLDLDELNARIIEFGEPKYRSKQIFEWLHKKKVTSFSEMTTLSSKLRDRLSEGFAIKTLIPEMTLNSKLLDTVKYLYRLCDGNKIETVLMKHRERDSICISSQVGCKMGCTFCASSLAPFIRNLLPSEMLLQIYETIRINPCLKKGDRPLSIVIMGVGEPLDNFDNVIKFLSLLSSPNGNNMSLRHVSLSTCGIVDRIDELASLKLGLTLSISLHGVNDSERGRIMPINKRYNIERLISSCRDYFNVTGRRISFEYSLISGVNDSDNHAYGLCKILSKMPRGSCHINLIPVNEVCETSFKKSTRSVSFSRIIEKSGITVTVRRTMGEDIDAACGQLRIR